MTPLKERGNSNRCLPTHRAPFFFFFLFNVGRKIKRLIGGSWSAIFNKPAASYSGTCIPAHPTFPLLPHLLVGS